MRRTQPSCRRRHVGVIDARRSGEDKGLRLNVTIQTRQGVTFSSRSRRNETGEENPLRHLRSLDEDVEVNQSSLGGEKIKLIKQLNSIDVIEVSGRIKRPHQVGSENILISS